jgi:alkylation response protein AidB-like acyl-CoA dehydrogenase
MIRAMVREFAETELGPRVLELDRKGDFPHDVVKRMGALGVLGITAPKEYGGSAAGHLTGTIAVEEIARVYPSMAFFLEATFAPYYTLGAFGSEEQKKAILPLVIRGEKVICFAATEPTGGSELARMATEAASDGDGYVINGRKVWITNAGVADYCIVLAKTGDRASLLIVEKGTPGFIIQRRQEMAGFKTGFVNEIAFSNCRVPKANRIGKEGAGVAIAASSFTVSRPSVGAVGLGIAQGAFDIALKYAKERVLYGRPISNLQAIQFMLAEMDTEIDAARWLIYRPAAAFDAGTSPRDIGKLSARAKMIGAEVAASVTMKAIQILGGCGVSPEFHLVRLLNDALEIFPATGTQQIMKIIQAGEILK